MDERRTIFALAQVALCAAVLFGFERDGSAQQPDGSAPPLDPAVEVAASAEQASEALDSGGAATDSQAIRGGRDVSYLAELDETELPEGLAPLTTYVADEITVRGTRPGDLRKRLWDLDIEIDRTIVSFFRMLNEVIVDDRFHVYCVRATRGRSRIREHMCYTGYQVDELYARQGIQSFMGSGMESFGSADESGTEEESQAVESDTQLVVGTEQGLLMDMERQYTEIVMAAIAEVPSIALAAENLVRMQEEREVLTGGKPAMSLSQYERYLARREAMLPFERLEYRRQRKAERQAERAAREAEREAERAAERAAQGRPVEPD